MENKFRLLGYYHDLKQDMGPETENVELANRLAPKLDASLRTLYNNPEVNEKFRNAIATDSTFIFKDEACQLYAYFTKDKKVRVTNVVYNKKQLFLVPFKYKAWFIPGEEIPLIVIRKPTDVAPDATTPAAAPNDEPSYMEVPQPRPSLLDRIKAFFKR